MSSASATSDHDDIHEEVSDEIKQQDREEEDYAVDAESKFDKPLPAYVTVSHNKSAYYYADRVRKVLRSEETCSLSGRGNAVEMASRVSELLKQQKVAVETKISTSVNAVPFFNARGDACWDEPAIMICIELTRGEHALCVMDNTQRRVMDIFEQNDAELKGYVSVDTVEQLRLANRFFANESQVSTATALMAQLKDNNDQLNMQNFIRYASALIHPLLKPYVLAKVFKDEFDITDDDDDVYYMLNEDDQETLF